MNALEVGWQMTEAQNGRAGHQYDFRQMLPTPEASHPSCGEFFFGTQFRCGIC
jgi:hypothetical protein